MGLRDRIKPINVKPPPADKPRAMKGFWSTLTADQKKQALAYQGDENHGAKKRGPKPSGNAKRLITLRLDPDILEAFRATGPGWQARINDTLRRHKP